MMLYCAMFASLRSFVGKYCEMCFVMRRKSMEQLLCNGGGRAWSRCLVVEKEEEHGAGVL